MSDDATQRLTNTSLRAAVLAAFIAASFAGAWLFGDTESGFSAPASAAADSAEETPDYDSDKIPVGDSPVLGPRDAPVTIVEFADFQCPFCQKATERLDKIRENFGDDVRIVFKNFPLPFHKQAPEAAYAAMAAEEQGKFWEMHDKLFANQDKFARDRMKELVTGWAAEIDGLDLKTFKEHYSDNQSKYDKRLDTDKELGRKLGVKGTPNFFINGERLEGAQPFNRFEKVITAKLKQAEKMRENGVPTSRLYAEAVQKNYEPDSADEAPDNQPTKVVEHVPVEDHDPVAGAKEDYLVTIVEFGNFQCPFCQKAVPTVQKLKENYGDKVRIVWKDNPLPFHNNAKPAARAALAAHLQGEFWAMHDKLFANQDKLGTDGIYNQFANDVGLDVAEFKNDMNSDKVDQMLNADMKLADEVGAKGTPTFWLNGIKVTGAQPYAEFERIVDNQIERAEKLRDKSDLNGEALYKKVVAKNKKDLASGADENQEDDEAERKKKNAEDKAQAKANREKLDVGESPVKGPDDAPVTIYEFSDFQCPYCKKARSHLKPLLDEYEGEVRIVYKNFPLSFHDEAKPAAKAALAAKQQGKFWKMYDLLFKNQNRLGSDGLYVELARELGLNVNTFKEAMNSDAVKNQIERDKTLGGKVGVKGTPAFFINGRRIVGAQPTETFRSAIQKALDDE